MLFSIVSALINRLCNTAKVCKVWVTKWSVCQQKTTARLSFLNLALKAKMYVMILHYSTLGFHV